MKEMIEKDSIKDLVTAMENEKSTDKVTEGALMMLPCVANDTSFTASFGPFCFVVR